MDSIQQFISTFDREEDLRGWAIDLRDNTGGATPAMVTGVGPLLSSGNLAHYVDASGQPASSFGYRNGGYHDFDGTDSVAQVISTVNYHVRRPGLPIAVLTNENSASAAEGLATLLAGEANTRSFGQPSAGLTTGDRLILLSDDAGLNLSVPYLATKEGEVFTGRIPVDVVVEPGAGEADSVLAAALNWLLSE